VLKAKFPAAKIVNFSATPLRADGQLMSGRIVYSYPIFRAIQEGYIKRLKAIVLNPRTLRYVRREDDAEVEVTLDEVRLLGETDADFRKSIVSSKATLDTIVDASIRELQTLRANSGETRLAIIASALNFEHCRQIVEAYKARGLRAEYVHSRENAPANKRVMQKLENHQLDVIVQVRKLGEGFDHKFLAVAAVFSVFANLSPFIQFVGRIMRVVKQNAPADPVNRGIVVFHAGSNVAKRWSDFQNYSEADQEYFDQLLPMEELPFTDGNELEMEPDMGGAHIAQLPEIRSQDGVRLEEIPLIENDPEALAAIQLLKNRGYTPEQVRDAFELKPVPVTKVRQRQALRGGLEMRTKTEAAKILQRRGINPEGKDLDKKTFNKTNLVFLKSAIDRQVNALVGKTSGKRHEFTRADLDKVDLEFTNLVNKAIEEVFHG